MRRNLNCAFIVCEEIIQVKIVLASISGLHGCREVHHRLLLKDQTYFPGSETQLVVKSKQKINSNTLQDPVAASNMQDKIEQNFDFFQGGEK